MPDTSPPLRAGFAFRGMDEGFEVGDRHGAVATVAQVAYVSLPAALCYAAPRRCRDLLRRSVAQEFFVHVALEDEVRVQGPRRGEVVLHAEADHVGAAGAHVVEVRALLDEQDARHA